MFFRMV